MSMLRSLALMFSRMPRFAQIGSGVAALAMVGAGVSSFSGGSGDRAAIRAVLAAHQAIDTRSCLTFRFAPGLNFENWAGRQFWMASTLWTAPDRHPFIFYAGPADDTAPEIVTDLTHRGVLERHLVPVSFLAGGVASAAIYTTPRNDPDFSYELVQPNFMARGSPLGTLVWPNSVSVAQGNGPQQPLYLLHPYLISQVSGVCVGLHLSGITDVKPHDRDWAGRDVMTATAVYRSDGLKDWMQTPVFRRTIGSFQDWENGKDIRHRLVFHRVPKGLELVGNQEEQ